MNKNPSQQTPPKIDPSVIKDRPVCDSWEDNLELGLRSLLHCYYQGYQDLDKVWLVLLRVQMDWTEAMNDSQSYMVEENEKSAKKGYGITFEELQKKAEEKEAALNKWVLKM